MSNSKNITKAVAYSVLVFSAMSSSVSYASACKVEYKEHNGSTKTVPLKVNEKKTINKRVDYVKNVGGNHGLDVSFDVSGASIEKFTMGTKPPHNRNPGSGSYWLHPEHKLKSIKCANSTAAKTMAEGMIKAGQSPAIIVKLAKDGFGMAEEEIAKLLKQIGVGAELAAKALNSVLQPTMSQLGTWMEYAGYAATQTAIALKKIGADAQQLAYVLKRHYQLSAEKAYQQLSSLYDASTAQIVTWMKYAKYGINEIAKALRTQANLSAKAAMDILIQVHKISKDQAIKALRVAGYTATQLASLTKDVERVISKPPIKFQQLSIKK